MRCIIKPKLQLLVAMALLGVITGCAAGLKHGSSSEAEFSHLVQQVQRAVVTIITYDMDNHPNGIGSGFFINAKGELITNYHVLKGAYKAEIKTFNGQKFFIDSIIAENEEVDLIKVKVDIPGGPRQWVSLASFEPTIAERVIVVGSPLGLEQTVSEGIVSAVREVPRIGKIFQLSAPISPGSSGGPVIGMDGQVVGVVSFQSVFGQNLNFAIPSSRLLELTDHQSPRHLADWTLHRVAQEPKKAAALCKMGFAHSVNGQYNKALQYYKKATEKSPDNAEAWSGLGHCYVGLEKPEQAIEAYKQAIRPDPNHVPAHYRLGRYYHHLGRYDDALDIYRKTLAFAPQHLPTWFDLGIVYGRLGRYEEGVKAFQEALRINPQYGPAHFNMGVAYGKLGRYQDAIDAFQQSLNIKPDLEPAYYNLGVMYGNLGRFQDELAAYKKAIQINPDYAPAHFGLGVRYVNSGNRPAALTEYKILQRLDSDSAEKLFRLIYP